MKEGKAFIDTNVLFYAFDESAKGKQAAAAELCTRLARTGTGVISSQVAKELLANLIRKMKLSPEDCKAPFEGLRDYELVLMSREILVEGCEIAARHSLSIWDSWIVAAAADAGCSRLYSEDFQGGFRIGELTVVNPFSGIE